VKSAYDLADAALPKAGGAVTGDVTLNAQSDLRFADADSSNWVAFQGPATVSSNVTWTLPAADGTTGQVLSTDGSGTLSWATGGGGGGGGASVTTSDTAPTSPADGDLWYDSVGGRMYVYYQDPDTSQWVDASPQGGGDAGFSKLEVGNTKAEVTDTGSNGTFTVTTEGTGRLSVDSSGRTLLGGVTANANGGVLQLSSGITFPATAVAATDPNTLDDYEEGTFTPTITAASGSPTYTVQDGFYTKVGRAVSVYLKVIFNKNTLSGMISVNGLPYTIKGASAINVNSYFVLNGTSTSIIALMGYSAGSNTKLDFYKTTAATTNNAGTAFNAADFGTSMQIEFNFVYSV
jgi:hypothetical protein